jgi:hypothetical protein
MGALKPRQTVVPIFQGDDLDAMVDLRTAVESAALTQSSGRLGDDDGDNRFTDAIRRHDAFMEEANARAAKVTLVALRNAAWRDMVAAHPPREPVKDDAGDVAEEWPQDEAVGFNVDSIAHPLLLATLERAAEVAVEYGEEPQEFGVDDLDDLSDADYSRLVDRAIGLNDRPGPDPKARLSSLLGPTSSETSGSPERLD